MKKFFVMFVALFVALSTNVSAGRLYDYYNNHPDFGGAGRMGIYICVYLPSVHVQEYNPPHYQIAFDCVYVNDDRGTEQWSYNVAKRYNWQTKKSYHVENGYWMEDGGRIERELADVVFRAAYGMDFYGY